MLNLLGYKVASLEYRAQRTTALRNENQRVNQHSRRIILFTRT